MKLNRTTDKFVFHFADWEKELLFDVLKLYPCVPSAHLTLSKSGGVPESSQKLLNDALKEQRAENQQQVQAFLADPRRFAKDETGCHLTLKAEDLEWLLQVLNDIRVGSWVLLGSPENEIEPTVLTAATLPHLWAMENSGYFQKHFLEALEN